MEHAEGVVRANAALEVGGDDLNAGRMVLDAAEQRHDSRPPGAFPNAAMGEGEAGGIGGGEDQQQTTPADQADRAEQAGDTGWAAPSREDHGEDEVGKAWEVEKDLIGQDLDVLAGRQRKAAMATPSSRPVGWLARTTVGPWLGRCGEGGGASDLQSACRVRGMHCGQWGMAVIAIGLGYDIHEVLEAQPGGEPCQERVRRR